MARCRVWPSHGDLGELEHLMHFNVAVLKETQPDERRVALVPSVSAKVVKLGAKPRMRSGACSAI